MNTSIIFALSQIPFCVFKDTYCCSVTKSCLSLCELQHARLPCFSLCPVVCSSSCPLSWWCYPTILSSVTSFFCPQSFPASGSFPIRWPFTSGGQSIGASVSAFSPSNEYWGLISFKIDWFDLIIFFDPLNNSIGWILLLLSFQRWGNRDTERWIFLSSVLAQTAITRYPGLGVGASPTEIYYLTVLEAGGPRLSISMVGFWRELTSCFIHSCILAVSPHGRERELALVFCLFFSKV